MQHYLAQGSGNRFVLFDCINGHCDSETLRKAHDLLLSTDRDDALILTDASRCFKGLHLKMLVMGQDGNLGEFCGNGARACAAYLFSMYPELGPFFVKTLQGFYELRSYGEGVYSVELPFPSKEINPRFITDGGKFCLEHGLTYREVIEPHLVIERELSDDSLLELGRFVNEHTTIFPHGININAFCFREGKLFVRTYERGVQRLTESCGTGSVASACVACFLQNTRVITQGGILEVLFHHQGIELKGEASFCTGIEDS